MEMEKGAITRFTLKPEWHHDAVVPEEGNKEAKGVPAVSAAAAIGCTEGVNSV